MPLSYHTGFSDTFHTMTPSRDDISRSLWARYGKRAVDAGVSLLALIPVIPILLLGIVAMQASAPGPIFFMQQRTGRNGRRFQPYKLRTMVATHKHNPNEHMPLNHSGIPPVGRLLRRFKIDELPQVLNVLFGDMTLIGPRPTIPEQTDNYDDFQKQRLLVRPGLTGLAQVNGNATIPWDERIKYDVHYVRHHNLAMDVAILFKTIGVVLRGEEKFARPFAESPYASRGNATNTEQPT